MAAIIPRSVVGIGEMRITGGTLSMTGVRETEQFRAHRGEASAEYLFLPAQQGTVYYGPDILCDDARLIGLRASIPTSIDEAVVFEFQGWDPTAS
jgi:hypothetical protein